MWPFRESSPNAGPNHLTLAWRWADVGMWGLCRTIAHPVDTQMDQKPPLQFDWWSIRLASAPHLCHGWQSCHEAFTLCWFDAGPASATLGQHQTGIGWMPRGMVTEPRDRPAPCSLGGVYVTVTPGCRPTQPAHNKRQIMGEGPHSGGDTLQFFNFWF